MPITDVFASRLAGPAGRMLDAPIRALVHEILREQGYASPAEIQALRDAARDLAARLARAESRLGDLTNGQEATLTELKAAREALAASRAELVAAVAQGAGPAAAAAPAPAATAAVAPLTAAPRIACGVADCDGLVRSKGFCSAHYQQWRRGTLDGFVGQDGHVRVGKRTVRVSDDFEGRPATMVGDVLTIDGKTVSYK